MNVFNAKEAFGNHLELILGSVGLDTISIALHSGNMLELTLRPRTVFPALQISCWSISSSSFWRSCRYVFRELNSSDRRVSDPSLTDL
jgi:hypothetical protein